MALGQGKALAWKKSMMTRKRKGNTIKKKDVFTRGQEQAHGALVVEFTLKVLTHLAGTRGLNTAAPLWGVNRN